VVVGVGRHGPRVGSASFCVLADDLNKTRRSVTWTASLDRVDVNNAKVRKRHLELEVARAIRARDRELAANRARGRE
jgi:hypothetical protein